MRATRRATTWRMKREGLDLGRIPPSCIDAGQLSVVVIGNERFRARAAVRRGRAVIRHHLRPVIRPAAAAHVVRAVVRSAASAAIGSRMVKVAP